MCEKGRMGEMRVFLWNRILGGVLVLLLIVSCASGRKEKGSPKAVPAKNQGLFMGDSRTEKSRSEGFFRADRRRKEEERRRFKDVSRPYHSREGSSRIYPWRDNRSRSEELHDSIRSERGFLF